MFESREGRTPKTRLRERRSLRECFAIDRMGYGGVEMDDRLAWTGAFRNAGLARDVAFGAEIRATSGIEKQGF